MGDKSLGDVGLWQLLPIGTWKNFVSLIGARSIIIRLLKSNCASLKVNVARLLNQVKIEKR